MHATPTPTSTASAITLKGVSRVFDGPANTAVEAVRSIDLDVANGEFLALIGPSGCGKSTLLRIIAGLDHATAGTVELHAAAAPTADGSRHSLAYAHPKSRSDIAFVFQDAHLLPWRNVLRNVALPLELRGVSKAARIEAAMRAIEQVGLSDAAKRYPAQLSGGMRMRASLARALVTDPKLLLLDEPFAALDEITRQQLDETLRELWLRRSMTVLFVTHSINEATFLADRAIVFTKRPARIVFDHRIELPQTRSAELRGEHCFAQQGAVLFEALRRGGSQ